MWGEVMSGTPTERYKDFIRQQKHVSIKQAIHLRKQYMRDLPKWCHPLWGYACAIPLFLVALFLPVLLQRLLHPLLFPAVFVVLALALISFLWGTGPALFMLVISLIGLDFYFIPPGGQLTLLNWWDIAQLIPFFFSSVIIILITGQRERAQINDYQDHLELQQYVEELETAHAYLGEVKRERKSFLSMASHELKTPVTTLRAYSELLLRRLAKRSTSIDASDLEAAFQRVNEQTIKLTTLIDKLLDVNTFRFHAMVLSKSRYDLNQLCRKVIEDQHVLTGREVVFSSSVEPLELQMDVDRMTQVIHNLVNNALKYSSQNKLVEVHVSQNDQHALLQVQDHGFGIAPDELPHIFETYYRTSRARSSTTSGFGLGLAISKEIINRHGGRIWCTSELGIGSTFFVELPYQNE